MSKIGKKPLVITNSELEINQIDDKKWEIKGPKGSSVFILNEDFQLKKEDNILQIVPLKLTKKNKALWGTLRKILENKIIGVSKGFEKVLILEGLGYSADKKDDKIVFNLGYSHLVELPIPVDVDIEIKAEKGKYFIHIRGNDKEKVGNFALQIKKLKPADRYHQKGFRYVNEVIKLKPVKRSVK